MIVLPPSRGPALQVTHCRPRYAPDVDGGVLEKAPVLDRQHRIDKSARQLVYRDLLASENAAGREGLSGVVFNDDRGRRRLGREPAGERQCIGAIAEKRAAADHQQCDRPDDTQREGAHTRGEFGCRQPPRRAPKPDDDCSREPKRMARR